MPNRKDSFTIRIEPELHKRLTRVRESCRPPLTQQQVVEHAIRRLVDEAEGGQLELGLEAMQQGGS